jgi:hypothetical protein
VRSVLTSSRAISVTKGVVTGGVRVHIFVFHVHHAKPRLTSYTDILEIVPDRFVFGDAALAMTEAAGVVGLWPVYCLTNSGQPHRTDRRAVRCAGEVGGCVRTGSGTLCASAGNALLAGELLRRGSRDDDCQGDRLQPSCDLCLSSDPLSAPGHQ